MQKKVSRIIFVHLVLGVLVALALFSIAAAKEIPQKNLSDIPDKFANEKLERGSGITPDSYFYFVEDKILSRFRGDLENREKKIAEFRQMIKEGKIEYAKKALERYKEYADNFEKEVSPEKKEEAQKSAAAIRNAIKEIEAEIPSSEKKELVDNIFEKESKISKAAEIAGKIKELCESLSKIDPEQYARVCKTDKDENAPKWQRDLDERLTEEQKKEAEEFFNTMSQCFSNPKDCQCNQIKIERFAEACREKAPLAAECKEGKKESCDKLNSGDDMRELLPEHLQSVLDKVERKFSRAEFDNFAPPECVDARAKTPEECQRIMFKKHAPEECIKALDEGKIKFDNPREAEKMCQDIMFVSNAPEECVQAGLRDPKECSKLMFREKAPKECLDAGLTGESQKDHKKCEELMRSKDEKEMQNRGQGFGFGKDCRSIQDKEERLKCFDEMTSNFESYKNQGQGMYGQIGFGKEGEYRGTGEFRGNFPEACVKANAQTPESCEKVLRDESDKRFKETRDYEQNFVKECNAKGGRWDCGYGSVSSGNPCRCFTDEKKEEYRPPERYQPPSNYCPPGQQCPQQQPYQQPQPGQQPGMMPPAPGPGAQYPPGRNAPGSALIPGTENPPSSTGTSEGSTSTFSPPTSESSSSGSSGSTSGGSESTSSSSSSSEPSSSGGSTSGGDSGSSSSGSSGESSSSSTTTGSAIIDFGDNGFLDYYFK